MKMSQKVAVRYMKKQGGSWDPDGWSPDWENFLLDEMLASDWIEGLQKGYYRIKAHPNCGLAKTYAELKKADPDAILLLDFEGEQVSDDDFSNLSEYDSPIRELNCRIYTVTDDGKDINIYQSHGGMKNADYMKWFGVRDTYQPSDVPAEITRWLVAYLYR
jgi:hypothetical protein